MLQFYKDPICSKCVQNFCIIAIKLPINAAIIIHLLKFRNTSGVGFIPFMPVFVCVFFLIFKLQLLVY